MSIEELVGDNGNYTLYEDLSNVPENDTYKLVINLYYQFATVYERDEDGNYTILVRYMACSTGKDETPTPTGTFEVGEIKARFHEFVIGGWAQYWTQLGDTNYYLHSVLYSRQDANTYTEASYVNLSSGLTASHGCIRFWVPDARWIWYNMAPGSIVEIIEGEEDEEMAEIRSQLVFPDYPNPRVVLSTGNIPMTDTWTYDGD